MAPFQISIIIYCILLKLFLLTLVRYRLRRWPWRRYAIYWVPSVFTVTVFNCLFQSNRVISSNHIYMLISCCISCRFSFLFFAFSLTNFTLYTSMWYRFNVCMPLGWDVFKLNWASFSYNGQNAVCMPLLSEICAQSDPSAFEKHRLRQIVEVTKENETLSRFGHFGRERSARSLSSQSPQCTLP